VAESDFDALLYDAAQNNEAAWWLLWEQFEPRLERLLRNPRITGRLSTEDDDIRNILLAVINKLRSDNARRLRDFVKQTEKGTFEAWLVVVTKRVAIDYMRAHHDYVDHRRNLDRSVQGEWIIPKALPNDSQIFGARASMTNRGTALALLRFAYDNLPKEQIAALELWILNHSYAAIAESLSLESAHDANKLVRAALERIRRHFR